MRPDGSRGRAGWARVGRTAHAPMRGLAANRAAGLLLLAYLYLHLAVLSLLLAGSGAWDAFLRSASSRPFLALDLLLFLAVLWHAANGVRVALVGSGIAVRRQRTLLWTATAVTLVAFVAATVALWQRG